ncbi:RNA polymerase sigma factor [Flagellimonas pacifica]|uniref:RNA polymerase sigma-70 factor, ECF subfamily n=1 Tax=Flagellimonas pacifica TaxID=1247520 RepID=A0A285N2W5_9FLAO|nr:sigma-70 family RNA polymerase sigma factor [Allomuricauda parva]SNZ02091.1 RNA polymerase sigma-70 factor, ECF subfamily [Allomuricauda parva]
MSTNQDQRLIKLILDGNVDAFAQLVEKYKHMVYTIAFRMVKRHEDAEEVSQDVFLNVHKNLRKFKKQSKFSSWLYRIAYNRALDHLKSNRNSIMVAMDSYEKSNEPLDDEIIRGFELEDRKMVVKDALRQLSPQDNALMVFFYFEELSLKEISKITEIKENAIKVRLYRSRQRLAEILSKKMTTETIKCYGKR